MENKKRKNWKHRVVENNQQKEEKLSEWEKNAPVIVKQRKARKRSKADSICSILLGW